MARDEEMSPSDKRKSAVIDGLVQQHEPLRLVEKAYVPPLRALAAVLRDEGRDAYARRVEELVKIANTSKATRLLIEQLDTFTDPRLEQTEPRIPAPSKGG